MAGFRFTTPSATFGEEEVEVGVWQDDEDESGDADPSALGSTHGAPRAQSRHEVLRRKYTLLETIGQGAFGKVKRVRCRGSGALRAVKMIDKRLIGDLEDVMRYTREFAILNALKHRHIIQLHEVLHNDLFFYIVMDLCRGTLLDIIAEKGAPPPDAPPSAAPVLSEDVARRYFRQLVAGVEHAHKHLVLHRDIKPDNILVDAQGKLCLADFGLSAMLADADAMLHTQVGMVFFFFFSLFFVSAVLADADAVLHTQVGTVQYMAPEVVRGSSYAAPADVWSLGATLYVMLVGTCPFGSRAATTAQTKRKSGGRREGRSLDQVKEEILGRCPSYPPYLSASVVQLLSRTLCKDPDLRITLSQIQVRWQPRLCVREYKCTRTHARTHVHTHTHTHTHRTTHGIWACQSVSRRWQAPSSTTARCPIILVVQKP